MVSALRSTDANLLSATVAKMKASSYVTDMTTQQLFDQCAEIVKAYPSDMYALPIGYPVAGRGFFPVTSGSFHEGRIDVPITPRKLMFVGQDWGAKGSLNCLNGNRDADMGSPTATRLFGLLKEAGIPLEECFFTNALFGVREGTNSTGHSPGWEGEDFINECVEALKYQFEVIQPRAIICLGLDAPQLLERVFPECKIWHSASGIKQIDQSNMSVLRLTSSLTPTTAAILLHPSYGRVNEKHRTFQGTIGKGADLKIIKSVWAQVNQ